MKQILKKILLCNFRGQTLIEVLVALSILGVVITAVTIVITTSLANAQHGKNQYIATKYSQEGIEIIRKIRNNDYTGFKTYNGNYCLAKNASTLGTVQSSCSTPNVDIFIRSVIVEQSPGCGSNIAKATVRVTWTDGKCSANQYCHKSEQVSCLSTLQRVQAP